VSEHRSSLGDQPNLPTFAAIHGLVMVGTPPHGSGGQKYGLLPLFKKNSLSAFVLWQQKGGL